jgi:hypothetical protein
VFTCGAVASAKADSWLISLAMSAIRAFVLLFVAQIYCVALVQAQSPSMIGTWNVEITFANEEHRAIRFEAQDQGKGTVLLLDPRAKVWGAPISFEAKWSVDKDSVSFSAPVEFMLGNVGRDAGTLTCKGKFETADLISGDVEFSPSVGDRPSKHGTFKATRGKAD